MTVPSELRSFRVFGRVAGRLIALGSLVAIVAGGCSDGVRTEPGFCATGGNAGGCGGSCGQNSLGGGGADTGAMGGAPASGGQSAGAGGESQGGSPQAGEAGSGGEPQAGADSGGAAGDNQGGAGGNAGSGAKGGAGGNAGSGAKGGAGGNAGSGAKGGAGGGTGCPQTVKNTSYDETTGITKAQDQVCAKAYGVNECGKACTQITPAACLACELASVDCAPTTDCGIATGVAQGGPAGGAPRAELCREAMECFRATDCGKVDPQLCYCGTSGTTCYSGGANGPCKAEVEAGLETEVGSEIASRWSVPTYGVGIARLRLDCDKDVCNAECFRP